MMKNSHLLLCPDRALRLLSPCQSRNSLLKIHKTSSRRWWCFVDKWIFHCFRTCIGSRIMVSRCWHATISPGIIVDSSVIEVTDASILLNFYACSLLQSGVAQLEDPVERSGEFMLLGESFESDQFRRCWHICTRDEE